MLIADVIVRATEQLQVAVAALEKNKNGTVLNACVQVKRLEEEGDTLYHEWLGRLFEGAARRADRDQVEGDLRQPGEDAGRHRGRRQRARIDLHQARVSMPHDVAVRPGDRRWSRWSSTSSTGSTTAPTPSPRWSRPGCSRPGVAVVWAAVFNFAAAFVVGTAVAKTIGKGLIEPVGGRSRTSSSARCSARSSGTSSPGTSACRARRATRSWAAWAARRSPRRGSPPCSSPAGSSRSSFIFISPLLGMALALMLTVALSWLLKSAPAGPGGPGVPPAPAACRRRSTR